jgi:hypothetical protein
VAAVLEEVSSETDFESFVEARCINVSVRAIGKVRKACSASQYTYCAFQAESAVFFFFVFLGRSLQF